MKINEWIFKYHNEKIINLKEDLMLKEIELIEQLGIIIENKTYTKYEYDLLKMRLIEYYKDEDMSKEELTYIKSLENKCVNIEEYYNLVLTFDFLDIKYETLFNIKINRKCA